MSMYWIYVIGRLGILFIFISVISAVAMFFSGFYYLVEKSSCENETLKRVGKIIKSSSIIFIVSLVIAVFTPSSEQMIKMYIVDNVVEYVEGNNNVKELPDKVVEACNKLLDDYIADKE